MAFSAPNALLGMPSRYGFQLRRSSLQAEFELRRRHTTLRSQSIAFSAAIQDLRGTWSALQLPILLRLIHVQTAGSSSR